MEHPKVPGSTAAYRRQKQIEDCLFENLRLRPYPSVSISDLCHQLGISRKSFYNYFPDKDSCFRSIISRKLHACILYLTAELPENASREEIITGYLAFWREEKNLMEIVKEEVDKRDEGCIVHGRWAGDIPGVWWWQDKKDCGGQLIEQNIHLLDGLRWLFGEPKTVYAVNGRGIVKPGIDAKPEYNTDDYSVCMLTFDNNVVATLTSSCYSTKGIRPTCGLHLTYSDIVMDYRLRNNLIMEYKDKLIDIKREERDHAYNLDRAFLDAIIAKDPKAVRSPYSDGLKSLKICFAAEKSMATGEVVEL